MRFIDLTHIVVNNMAVYPGDAPPTLQEIAMVEKDGYGKFELCSAMHAGTHIDAPLHMLAKGKKISDFPPSKFYGHGVFIDAIDKEKLTADLLDGIKINPGDIVILNTGWHKYFGQAKYFESPPLIDISFAEKLISLNPALIGMDTPGPDEQPFEVHKAFLSNDILIIENLANTEALRGINNFDVVAMPLNIDADASLARVVARVDPIK